MPKVREIMRQDVIKVNRNTPVDQIARKMRERNEDAVVIYENGKFYGIVTRDSIVTDIAVNARNGKRNSKGVLMHNGLPKVSPGADLIEAAEIMANRNVEYMIVVQNGKFLGMLTLKDLLRESPALAFIVMTTQSETKVQKNNRFAVEIA